MKKYLIIFILGLSPSVVFAQQGLLGLIDSFGGLVNPTVAVLVAIALLGFFWGLAKFIFRVGGDEKAVEDGKRLMKWGLIALFVITSVWGLVGFLEEAFIPGYEDVEPVGDPSPQPFLPPVDPF